MREALKEARKAAKAGEVPVGAVVVSGGKVVGRGYNRSIMDRDPSAHAEMVAVRKAAKKIRNYRLSSCEIYATIEPCPMCAGALVWARISKVVFGAKDAKAGACGSVMNVARCRKLNHRMKITGGVLAKECRALIQHFFKTRRKKAANNYSKRVSK